MTLRTALSLHPVSRAFVAPSSPFRALVTTDTRPRCPAGRDAYLGGPHRHADAANLWRRRCGRREAWPACRPFIATSAFWTPPDGRPSTPRNAMVGRPDLEHGDRPCGSEVRARSTLRGARAGRGDVSHDARVAGRRAVTSRLAGLDDANQPRTGGLVAPSTSRTTTRFLETPFILDRLRPRVAHPAASPTARAGWSSTTRLTVMDVLDAGGDRGRGTHHRDDLLRPRATRAGPATTRARHRRRRDRSVRRPR